LREASALFKGLRREIPHEARPVLRHPLEIVGNRFSQSIDVSLEKAIRKPTGDLYAIGVQQAPQDVVSHAADGDADLLGGPSQAFPFWQPCLV
jgi:hypothetical protein